MPNLSPKRKEAAECNSNSQCNSKASISDAHIQPQSQGRDKRKRRYFVWQLLNSEEGGVRYSAYDSRWWCDQKGNFKGAALFGHRIPLIPTECDVYKLNPARRAAHHLTLMSDKAITQSRASNQRRSKHLDIP